MVFSLLWLLSLTAGLPLKAAVFSALWRLIDRRLGVHLVLGYRITGVQRILMGGKHGGICSAFNDKSISGLAEFVVVISLLLLWQIGLLTPCNLRSKLRQRSNELAAIKPQICCLELIPN